MSPGGKKSPSGPSVSRSGSSRGSHYWKSGSHGLRHREPKWLGWRRSEKDGRSMKQLIGGGDAAEKVNACFNSELDAQYPERRAQMTRASDVEAPAALGESAGGPGSQADIGAFSDSKSLHHENVRRVELGGTTVYNAVVDQHRRLGDRVGDEPADGDLLRQTTPDKGGCGARETTPTSVWKVAR